TALQPLTNVVLAALFEYAVAFYDVELGRLFTGRQSWEETKPSLMLTLRKVGSQITKDYIAFPALAAAVGYLLPTKTAFGTRRWAVSSGKNRRKERAKKHAKSAAQAALIANLTRNLWAYAVIFCGHFPDDAETFTKRTLEEESKAEWYLRQMLGSANFRGGKLLTILSGNLNYQIEHHLYPDMPSNRLAQIGKEVEKIAAESVQPNHSYSSARQLLGVQRTILQRTPPNRFARAPKHNAAELRADEDFDTYPEVNATMGPPSLAAPRARLKALRPK